MIKPIHLILNLVLLLSTIPLAHSASTSTQSQSNLVESQSSDDKLNTLLKVPGVQAQYDACKTANTPLDKMSECIWSGNNSNIKALDQATKDNVKKEYEKTLKTTDANGTERVDYTNTSAVTSTQFANDKNPAIKKLSEIIKTKLHEALYGNQTDKNKIAQVSQTEFHDLYEAEISKGIVDALSSYCIKVNYDTVNTEGQDNCIKDKLCKNEKDKASIDKCANKCAIFTIPDNEELIAKQKAKNLEKIQNGDFEGSTNLIGSCIANVPNACYYVTDSTSNSKKEACVIADFLKASKKNLELNKQIKSAYSELGKGAEVEISNFAQAKPLDTQVAVNVTSKDVGDAFKDNKDFKQLQADATDCTTNVTDPKCKELIDTNSADKEKAVAEFGLRKLAQEDELTKNLKESTDNTKITQYLKDEGFDDAKIKQMTSNPEDIQKIKDTIIKKFKDEKEALIKELSDRVEKTTTTNAGNITNDDSTKLSNIQKELQSKDKDLQDLTRFSNLASSYLTSELKNGPANSNNTSRNLASFQDEISSTKDKKTKLQDLVKPSADSNANKGSVIDTSALLEILGI